MSEEQKAPSKEEVLQFLNEQIEVKEVQLKLQSLNADLAEARAREIKALAFVAQMTSPQPTAQDDIPQGAVPHTLTQEDLNQNPELVEQGYKVGDDVLVEHEPTEDKPSKSRGLKKNK